MKRDGTLELQANNGPPLTSERPAGLSSTGKLTGKYTMLLLGPGLPSPGEAAWASGGWLCGGHQLLSEQATKLSLPQAPFTLPISIGSLSLSNHVETRTSISSPATSHAGIFGDCEKFLIFTSFNCLYLYGQGASSVPENWT